MLAFAAFQRKLGTQQSSIDASRDEKAELMRSKLRLERGGHGGEQNVSGELKEDAPDCDGADFVGGWLGHGDKAASYDSGAE